MKTMNKILALALAFAMALTLFAGAVFTDNSDIGGDYKDAVNMLVELKVISGYPDGSFKPQGLIKRSEFCKMAYVLKYGSDDQGKLFAGQKSNFKDVEGVSELAWAKGYINYCASQKIIAGVGANRFNPNGNITVTEAAKMLLVILGCDPAKEGFTGSNWAANATSMAMTTGVFDGWVGDPTAPATRELIAKLMSNTIFAPVYIYSPITGLGSQYNAVNNNENATLGEQTMKLQVITGIAIANENLATTIPDRNDSEWFNKQATLDATGHFTAADYATVTASPTAQGKSTINYEYLSSNTQNSGMAYKNITIETTIPDEYIGALVNIYCTGEGSAKYGTVSNVKVIGSPILNSDCVIAEANTAGMKFYPNNDGSTKTDIKPYVGITALDGKNYKMDSGSNQRARFAEKLASPISTLGLANLFADRFFVVEDRTAPNQSASYANIDSDVLAITVYTPTIQSFRFVSFDGGNTFAYALSNPVNAGVVTSYNATSKSINVATQGSLLPLSGVRNLDDYNIAADLVRDDVIVYNFANGKVNVAKADTITGKASNVYDKKATIDGKKYIADITMNAGSSFGGVNVVNNFSNYLSITSNNVATNIYFLANGVVFGVKQGDTASGAQTEYAVVMALQVEPGAFANVKVKLGFADGTTGTYDVGKFYRYPGEDNDTDSIANFADNYGLGTIVRYKLSGASVDLSGETSVQADAPATLANSTLRIGMTSYQYDNNSLIFAIDQGELKIYRLSELNGVTSMDAAAAKSSSGANTIQTLLVGSLVNPVGIKGELTGNVGYLLNNASYQYNSDSGKWYVTLKLATKDGVKDLVSIDEVTGIEFGGASYNNPVPGFTVFDADKNRVGSVVVSYKVDSNGKLSSIGAMDDPINYYWADGTADGLVPSAPTGTWYVTNIGSYSDTRINFYTSEVLNGATTFPAQSSLTGMNLASTYDVVTVSNNDQIGNHIITASTGENYVAGSFNAIVYVENSKITKIFSIDN